MAHINDSLKTMNDALSALQAKVDLLLSSRAGLTAAEFEARIAAATQEGVDAVLAQLDGLDVTDISVRAELQRRLIEIMNAVDPSTKFAFEFFSAPYSIADTISVSGASTVAGDDSVDISSTSGLVAGREYVIETDTQQAVIVVSEVLSDTRFRTKDDIPVSMTGATLRRTNWTFGSTGGATAQSGQVYYSDPINLDVATQTVKSLVVRLSQASALPTVSFQDASHLSWTEAPWKWTRTSAQVTDGETGYRDVEYVVPASGQVALKIVADGPSTIKYMVALTRDTGLQGDHRPPATPINVSPVANATDVGRTPTLQLSAYVHPALTGQGGVQFQISKVADDFATPLNLVLDTGLIPAAMGMCVPADVLAVSTTYYWRARYADDEGGISDWSAPTMFTTAAAFAVLAVVAPTNLTPVNHATKIGPTPSLTASGMVSSGGSAAHTASQWQIAADAAFASIQFDSGADPTNRTAITLDDAHKLGDGDHYFRSRQQGTFAWDDATSEEAVATAIGSGAISLATAVVLDSTRVLVGYVEAGAARAVVLTIGAARDIVAGTPVALTAAAITCLAATKIGEDKALVGYVGASSYAYAVALTVSGTTITVNTPLTVLSAACTCLALCGVDTDKAVLATNDGDGKAYVLSVASTTVSAGAALTFNAGVTGPDIALATLDTTRAVCCYRDAGSSAGGNTVVLSLVGTTLTAGAEVAFCANATSLISMASLDTTTCAVGYLDGGDATIRVMALSVAGTVLTAGTASTLPGTGCTALRLTAETAASFLATSLDGSASARASRVSVPLSECIVSPALVYATGAGSPAIAVPTSGALVAVYDQAGGKAQCHKLLGDVLWSEWSAPTTFNVVTFARFVAALQGDYSDAYTGVVVAPDGAMYVSGYEYSTSDGAAINCIIAKYEAGQETPTWQSHVPVAGGTPSGTNICVLTDGGIVVCWSIADSSRVDLYAVKVDQSGAVVWQRRYAGSGRTYTRRIAAHPGGGFVVAGMDGTGTSYWRAVVLKVNADGSLAWDRRIPLETDSRATAIGCSPAGDVYVGGALGPSGNGYMLKWSASGVFQWRITLGGYYYTPYAFAFDSDGYVYCLSNYYASAAWGYPLITKLSAAGGLQWHYKLSSGYYEQAWDIQISNDGSTIYICGNTNYGLSHKQAFVAAISTDHLQWQKGLTGSYDDTLVSMALDADGNIYCAGAFCSIPATPSPDAVLLSMSPDADGCAGAIAGFPMLTWSDTQLGWTATSPGTSLSTSSVGDAAGFAVSTADSAVTSMDMESAWSAY